MKVVFDHQTFSSQAVGGVPRYYMELLVGLNRLKGIDAEIIAPLYCNDYLKESGFKQGIKVRAIPKVYRLIQPLNQILSKSLIKKSQPDILHETYYQYNSLAPANCPVVITALDVLHEKFHENFRVKDTTTMRKRAAIRRASHVIAISENTRQDYIEFFNIHPSKISTIHLGCSFLEEKYQNLSVAKEGEPFILYVGGRKGYKNFRNLLIAYFSSSLLRSNFQLICFGGGAFSSEERALIASLSNGSTKSVIQLSGNDERLAKAYKSASVFVYPSLYEGFGLPPIEAMALGCPVACSDRSSIPEVVGDAALKFNPDSPEDMRSKLELLLTSPHLQEQLVALGHKRAETFSWKSCVEKTAGLYQTIAK